MVVCSFLNTTVLFLISQYFFNHEEVVGIGGEFRDVVITEAIGVYHCCTRGRYPDFDALNRGAGAQVGYLTPDRRLVSRFNGIVRVVRLRAGKDQPDYKREH